jgi:protoporphyrinogen oxidase
VFIKAVNRDKLQGMKKVVILGAGISGLSAAYHLQRKGIQSIVFEKDSEWGGLCGCFTVGGFLFDRFPHISFTNNKYVRSFFKKSAFPLRFRWIT